MSPAWGYCSIVLNVLFYVKYWFYTIQKSPQWYFIIGYGGHSSRQDMEIQLAWRPLLGGRAPLSRSFGFDLTAIRVEFGFRLFQRVDLPARIGLERIQGDWRVVLQFKKQKAQIAGFGIRRLDGHSFRASHLLVQGIDYHVVEKGRKSVDRHEVHGMEVALRRNRHAIGALAFG